MGVNNINQQGSIVPFRGGSTIGRVRASSRYFTGKAEAMKTIRTAIIICVMFTMSLPAGVVPEGGEHGMVVGSGGHQSGPSVALWSVGGLVAWENSSSTGTKRIAVQALDGQGRGTGSVQVISQNVDRVNDTDPMIAQVDESTAVVVWSSGRRGNSDVYLALVARNGARLGEIQQVNQQASRNQGEPAVGVSADGTIMVVWESDQQDGDGSGVYGRIYNSAGVSQGGELPLNQTTAGNQSQPAVEGLDENRFLVSWVSGVIAGRNSVGGLKLRSQVKGRFYRGGSAQRNEFAISGNDVIVQSPSTHLSTDGRLHAGWMQRTEINSQDKFDIWGVTLDPASGVPAGNPAKINQYSSGEQLHPQIVSQGGEVVYVWESVGQDLGGHGIVGRSYPNGEEFVINSQRNLDQYDPAIAADNQGRVIVAWANTISATSSILSAQHFRIGAGNVSPVVASTTPALQTVPSTPAAPNIVPPSQTPAPTAVVASSSGSNHSTPASTPTVTAPTFPQPPTASAATRAVAAQASIRSGTTTPGMAAAPSQPAAATFGINRFPTRSSLRSGLTTPGQAASSALQQMAAQRQQLRSGSSSAFGNRIRSGSYGSGQSPASLSRAAMMNPALRSTAANTFQRPTVRSGAYPGTSTFAARNSNGVGAVRSLAGRPGTTAGISSGTAQNRFELMRQQAQNASSQLAQTRQVPASLQLQGSQMNLQWQGRSGTRYQVQGSNDRVSWQNHGSIRSGTETSSAAVDRSYRYYRVVERN